MSEPTAEENEYTWIEQYKTLLDHRVNGTPSLDKEEFMAIVQEGRKRLGELAPTFEKAVQEWAHRPLLRCPVCSAFNDDKCATEC